MFLGLSGISAPDIYMSGGENLYVVGVNNVETPTLREGVSNPLKKGSHPSGGSLFDNNVEAPTQREGVSSYDLQNL